MRVLMLHNRYRHPGGEDAVARREAAMLRAHGVEVIEHGVDNEADTVTGNLALLARSAWSRGSYQTMGGLCAEIRPDIVHVHNFWMRLTPSVHAAAREAGAATVQTLHNYRLVCANGFLLRDGKICEDCVGAAPWRGVVRRCYHDSLIASAAAARFIVHNRARGTWTRDVDAFIAPSESARSKLMRADLPAGRVFVKPNFTEDPGPAGLPPSASRTLVFAGRLSTEKGVRPLLSAWAQVMRSGPHGARLIIAGDGPERGALESHAEALGLPPRTLTFAGRLPPGELMDLIKGARAVVLPSLCLETFGSTIIEAFACGRPAIVSDLGSPGELVREGWNGNKVPAGDPVRLESALAAMLADDPRADALGRNARHDYLAEFTPQRNFQLLMQVYESALRYSPETRVQPARKRRLAEPACTA